MPVFTVNHVGSARLKAQIYSSIVLDLLFFMSIVTVQSC
jgi:hypothetical protein